MLQRNEDAWRALRTTFRSRAVWDDREKGKQGYAWMVRYTLRFLDAYLKGDLGGLKFLKRPPAKNGVPAGTLNVSYRRARGVPCSFDGFRQEVGRAGFRHVPRIFRRFLRERRDITFKEEDLRAWAEELSDTGHLAQAAEILVLNVHLHPNSSEAEASLGHVYLNLGQRASAIACYRRALKKDPQNCEASAMVKELCASESV